MYIYFLTHKLLAVVLLIRTVTSIKDVHLNHLKLNTVKSLLKILSKYENDVKYVIIQADNHWKIHNHGSGSHNNKSDYKEDKRFVKPGRHVLIKRLLPHGFPASKLEYDYKFKTYYRPLVRVHKRKVLPKIETILNLNGNPDGMDKYGIDFYDYFDNDENVLKFAKKNEPSENLEHFKVTEIGGELDADKELLQPFVTDFSEDHKLLDDASTQLVIKQIIPKLLRLPKTKSNKGVIKQLNKILSLRAEQKSGEDNDPMAPGKLVHLENEEVDHGPPKPKKWIPHYTPWNFWTYKKIIYQDVCPKGQVKISNLCIWVPPH